MKQKKTHIEKIPAILYGKPSEKLFLCVHGKNSRKEEAEPFAEIAEKQGHQVISFDLPGHGERAGDPEPCTARNGVRDLNIIYSALENDYSEFSLFACSLGAYFSLIAYSRIRFAQCLFLSPILDMKRLIENMMRWANVSESELKEKGTIETSFGEPLSWDYYQYVRENPVVQWDSPTSILYGENDHLTEKCVLDRFAEKHHCRVSLMKNGEHFFHTEEQLLYLSRWLRETLSR